MVNLILNSAQAIYFDVQPMQAAWPIIAWWIIGGIGAAILGGGIIFLCSDTEKIEGQTISVLGMIAAGKTTLLRQLQGKSVSTSYQGTNVDTYTQFILLVKGKKYLIHGGNDIGGGEAYIKQYYEDMIKASDITFFVFNCYEYLNNDDYAKNVRARLDFINRQAAKDAKKIVTIGSHVDKFEKEKQKMLLSDMQKSVSGKTYEHLMQKNFFMLNLMEKDGINNMLDKIF